MIGHTTSTRSEYRNRGRNIQLWLKDNKPCIFVIVDDYSDMIPYMHRLVMTDDNYALDNEKTNQIIELFNNSTLEDCSEDENNHNIMAFGKKV
ncbi:MAG: hypothetical protein HC877_24230 [Thioploca sp.]|nr:hypothetical protein [Thioploca sp.]